MRLDRVKGCQQVLIYGWTSVIPIFLQPQILKWSSSKKVKFLKIRRRIFKNLAFFEELHADNRDWWNVAKMWPKVSNEVKWQYLTISNLISYTGTIVSFGNRLQHLLISKLKISATFGILLVRPSDFWDVPNPIHRIWFSLLRKEGCEGWQYDFEA